jgi:hypothetical protein
LPPELSSMADAAISAASSLAERFTP